MFIQDRNDYLQTASLVLGLFWLDSSEEFHLLDKILHILSRFSIINENKDFLQMKAIEKFNKRTGLLFFVLRQGSIQIESLSTGAAK